MGVVYQAHGPQLAQPGLMRCVGRGVCLSAVALSLAVGSAVRLDAQDPIDDPELQRTTTAGGAGLALEPGAPPPPVLPDTVTRGENGRVTVRAVRVEGLRVDGALDEPIYQTVHPIGNFVQIEPDAGAPATEPTEAWVLFDNENLYVSARLWDRAPESVWVANEMRRDSFNVFQNELFGIMLDTFYDRRNGLLFTINPIGGRQDAQVSNESSYNGDWNPVWAVETGRFDGGWTVEAAIPFKSMRYRPGPGQVWGIQFRRGIRHKNEVSHLTAIDPGLAATAMYQISQSATLVGIEVPATGRLLEIKPYVIGDLTSNRSASPAVSNDLGGTLGLDLVKVGLSENLTADFTLNTDFAQVEADEQQVNLTRFSLFFPEKREFFLENQGTFGFGGTSSGGPSGGSGRHAGHVLQSADRTTRWEGGADHRRWTGDRPCRHVHARRDQHPDRRRAFEWRADNQLHRRPHQEGCVTAEQHRRDLHEPLYHCYRSGVEPDLRGRRYVCLL